jgi:hypothetical protein
MSRPEDLPGFEPGDWLRLEPLHRSSEVASGLAARFHDPAWALTRQWQLGEFAGQDAGSPVLVALEGRSTLVSHWRPALGDDQPWVPYRPGDGPLDMLVEAEQAPPADEPLRVEGGAQFVRLLAEAGLSAKLPEVLARAGFDPPLERGEDDLDLVALTAAHVPDGRALAAAIDGGTLAVDGLDAVAKRWRGWWAEAAPDRGPDTFDPHRFEHSAQLAVDGRALRADEYLGDGLDWFSVDADPSATAPPPGRPLRFARTALASPVRYGGLPADRFWELEDAHVDLGSAAVGTLDTGRLLLIAFAEVFGNDWFLLPLEVPTGSLTVVERLVVSDTFGQQRTVERAGRDTPAWSMFTVEGTDEGLLVLPSGRGLVGEPVERIALARDELANLAWAIEREYTDDRGRRVDRPTAWIADRAAFDAARTGEGDRPGADGAAAGADGAAVPAGGQAPAPPPAYVVQTVVPDYWLPLVPRAVRLGSIRFELVPLLQDDGASGPRGRLLTDDSWVHEEEVPREGAAVTRRPVLMRWFDGSLHGWTRREKTPGRGESSSGLAFDTVRPSEPWP